MDLKGRTALVTGAGSGIGKAIAVAFANEGANVLVNDLTEAGRSVADDIGGTFIQADLSDGEAVVALARHALEACGRIDILVNNAGFQHVAPVEEFPEDTWVKMIQVMLIAAFQLTHTAWSQAHTRVPISLPSTGS
jgi:3-hydroxybutyrate dehydrogenase